MSELPRRLSPGTALTSNWLNRLVDFLRSRDLRAGPGVKLTRTPSGTTISVPPAKRDPDPDEPPMPFDCRLSLEYPNGEEDDPETHLYCYVPQASGWICQGCNGAVQPAVRALTGQTLDGDWLDCGEIEAGDSAWIFFTVTAANYARYGHATPLYETPQAHVGIKSAGTSLPIPSGREEAYVLFPSARIATLTATNGLRQIFHGLYSSDALFGDDGLNGNGWGSTTGIRSLSVSNCDYWGNPGVASLHGFRDPTTISNPYKSGGTPPSHDDDLLVLVRVKSSDGKTAELQYLPLSELAPDDIEIPEPYEPPEGLDELIESLPTECPTGHDNTQQLGYIWNPCDLFDGNGNKVADAGWQVAMYWPIGGDYTKCKGASIGNSSGNQVIDLDARVLNGDGNDGAGNNWQTNGHFSASGQVSAGADIVAHGSLVSFQSVVLVDEQNDTIRSFLPTQITVNGQAITVLAEAQP